MDRSPKILCATAAAVLLAGALRVGARADARCYRRRNVTLSKCLNTTPATALGWYS